MYTMSQFSNLLKAVEDNCPADTIAKADMFFSKIEQKYTKNYSLMSDADVLYNSRFLYNELSKAHGQILKLHNDKDVCVAKYIMYKIQYRLRNRHIMTLQTTELINDMDSYDPTELRGYEVKLQYLDRLIQVYRPYADRLQENIVFRVANPEVYDQLGGKERVLVDRTQSLMQLIVAKVMYDLKRASVLTDKDVSILKDHIILSYQP